MKLIHKPICDCLKNNNNNYFIICRNEPVITGEAAKSRNYKNCYVVKCGGFIYSFDSNYEYELVIKKIVSKGVIEFIKKD